MSTKRVIKLTLNKDGVAAPAVHAAEAATNVVRWTIPALKVADIANPPPMGFAAFEINSPDGPDEKRRRYISWILGRAFQDLARGVRETLEQAYIYTMALRLVPEVTTYGELVSGITEIKQRANRLNFPMLMQAVEAQLTTALNFGREFASMQKARNCLEHRNGVVASLDCDEDGKQLTLTLPILRFYAQTELGEAEIYPNMFFEAEAAVVAKRESRTFTYALGSKLEFEPEQFHGFAQACWFFANDVAGKLPDAPQGEGEIAKAPIT